MNDAHPATEGPSQDAFRGLVVALAVVGAAWQLAVIALALRHAAPLVWVGGALGIDLPIATRSLVATHRWWFVLPILSVGAAYAANRHAATAPRLAIAAAVAPLVVAVVLQTWMNEAVLAPFRAILDSIR